MMTPLRAVVFDWAGTMVDFGSRAPVIALCKCFERAGVPVTETEARADMGLAKIDHIAAILAAPRVAKAWRERHGSAPSEADAAALFAGIGPLMREAAQDCADLIPGAAAVAGWLQDAGVKVGSCTGYTREMMDPILSRAADQGYRPDYVVCAGETAAGRPSPLMLWKNLVELAAWPAEACVKVDDAAVGIAEGRAAGVWTIGIAVTGNGVGLSRAAWEALASDERANRRDAAAARLQGAGAHLVIGSVADLPGALSALSLALPTGD